MRAHIHARLRERGLAKVAGLLTRLEAFFGHTSDKESNMKKTLIGTIVAHPNNTADITTTLN